ncbi:hypothetical protein CUMW_240200 [Citrus unshiu]|uniref:FBD domain-containing protein n=1 Tax=Citrus unshiu TaxID=55188 RepID=A0A2H5QL22_CITUN|nr:hypothetical protein CUMW_240200 [Citrus unshiu]
MLAAKMSDRLQQSSRGPLSSPNNLLISIYGDKLMLLERVLFISRKWRTSPLSCPVPFSPLLENLKMDSCCFPDLKILDISSNSLKSLTLERIEFGGDELDNYKLKIACSNLESFNIFAPLLPDFTLESLNSLQNAFIFLETIGEYMEAKEICHRMSKILNGLRDVKVLKLSCTLYQFNLVKVSLGLILVPLLFFARSPPSASRGEKKKKKKRKK